MPEEACRRATAGGRRVVEDPIRHGKRAGNACGDERGELRLVACGDAGEQGGGDAVHEREVRHVNLDRSLGRQHKRAAGHVEVHVLRGLERRAGFKRELVGMTHHKRVRERRALVHRQGAVALRARTPHGQRAGLHDRAALVLLQTSLHDHLASSLLHDHAVGRRYPGIEVDGMFRRVDRERVAAEIQAPVGVSRRGCSQLLRFPDGHVGFRRDPRVVHEPHGIVLVFHAEASRAHDHVRDIDVDVSVARHALVDAVGLQGAGVAVE